MGVEDVTLMDELMVLGVPKKSVDVIQQIISISENIVIASNEESIIIRGKSGKKIDITGQRIGTHIVYCDKNVIIVLWPERFTYNYLVIAGAVGGWNVCRNDSDSD